jgi:hypothetical protein
MGNGKRVKHFSLKEGKDGGVTHNIFRIIPPILSNAATGRWAVWEPIHWGYMGVNSKDPTKTVYRSFRCPGTKASPCPECILINEVMEKRETLDPSKGEYRKSGKNKPDEDVLPLLRPLEAFLDGSGPKREGRHRCDRKWKLNVFAREDQQAGDLRISSALYNQLKAFPDKAATNPGLIDKLLRRAKPIDAIAPKQGVWFDFIRTGNGFGTQDKVEIVRDDDEQPIIAPIVEGGVIDVAVDTGCGDLSSCAPAAELTVEQIQRLTDLWRAGKADPEEVDKVFNSSAKSKPVQTRFRGDDEVNPNELFQDDEPPVREEVKKAEPVTSTDDEDPEVLELKLKLAAARSKKTAEKAQPAEKTVETTKAKEVEAAPAPAAVSAKERIANFMNTMKTKEPK